MRAIADRLTYANVVATLALVIAVGAGTAYAANTVSSTDIVNGEVKALDIATNGVQHAEIATGAVRTAEIQDRQVQAEDLAPGVAPGASGARAWALVDANGALLRSKQVTGVTKPFDGAYCIDPGSGIDPTTAVMVVGEDFGLDGTSETFHTVSQVEWDSTPDDCPAGTMEVQTFLGNGNPASGGELDLGGFDLDRIDQGFSFVIP